MSIEVNEPNLVTPDLDGVPEDDSAEPADADTDHHGLEREGEDG